MMRALASGSVVALLLVGGCQHDASVSPAPKPSRERDSSSQARGVSLRFEDVTAASGVAFGYSSGADTNLFTMLESLGGGVATFDYDGDGVLDLAFPGGGKLPMRGTITGRPLGLFRQLAPWQFSRLDRAARLDDSALYTHGVAVGDYNEDGFDDLLVTGYGDLQLWCNQGDGTFVEVSAQASLHDPSWSSSAAWGDLSGDGFLDLYVAHYVDWSWKNDPPCAGPPPHGRDVCPPKLFAGLKNVVFYAQGDGTFRDASLEAGLDPGGKGLGVLVGDFDFDGDRDVYVANDEVLNYLYLNDGTGKLSEEAGLRGVAADDAGLANGSMGVALFDYNLDGWLDLWVSNFEHEPFALYRNDGAAHFTHISRRTGIAALPHIFVGFGTVAGDWDRDGREDIAIANGHVIRFSPSATVKQEPLVLINQASRFYRCQFPPYSYFSQTHTGRGLAVADLDTDGDLDMVVSHQEEPVALLRNDSQPVGSWLSLRLIGKRSGRTPIGATVRLKTTEGELVRQVAGGGSYLSHSDQRLFWGLPPTSQVTGLSIVWPSGVRQELEPLSLEQCHTLIEPDE